MAHVDILIFALIAAVLIARLWAVLGRRNDEDPQRPNPFVAPAADNDDASFHLEGRKETNPQPFAPLLVAPTSLLGALEQIRELDPVFDEKQFLQTARTIFTTVVNGFAKGDLSEAATMLGPAVMPHFQQEIDGRRQKGESLETRIVRIKDAETTAAHVEDNNAVITVRFESEQENILRDATGAVLAGTPGHSEEIVDLWTFARDTKTPDANWRVIETKS